MKIHTENMHGNIHDAATTINKRGWAQYLVSLTFNGRLLTVAVFKMPDDMVYKIRTAQKAFAGDSHHDDVPHLPAKEKL